MCLVAQLCPTLCDPMDCSLPGSSVHGDFPDRILEWVPSSRGIFPTQGSNSGLLHCRRILYSLSHQRNPRILEWVAYSFSGDLPNPGIESGSPALQADSLPAKLPGKTYKHSTLGVCFLCSNISVSSSGPYSSCSGNTLFSAFSDWGGTWGISAHSVQFHYKLKIAF